MSTTAQITANRANAQLSTGPATKAGAARSSQNARTHGLTGRCVHLAPAEEEPYRIFREGIFSDLAPKGVSEEYLVDSIIDNRWRVDQISKIESGLYLIGEAENKAALADYPAQNALEVSRALTFRRNQKEFDKLNRYQSRLQRQATQDLKKLEELQSIRKASELKDFQDAAALYAKSLNTAEEFNPAEFGFVWSNEELFDAASKARQKQDARDKFPIQKVLTYSDIPHAA